MDVLCFGQQNWDWCWTGKQQLMSRLAIRGHRVLYLDPDWRRSAEVVRPHQPLSHLGLRREGPRQLWVHTIPIHGALGFRASRHLARLALPRIAEHLGFRTPVACALHPTVLPRLDALRWTGLVYYAVDEHTAFGGMSEDDKQHHRQHEEAMVRRADVALAVSPRLQRRFAEHNAQSHVLENGADIDHFSPESLERRSSQPAVAGLPRPLLGFIGQVDERLDQDLLATLAERRPEWTILLVGRRKAGVDFSTLDPLPNVHMLGYQPYAALPEIARDVAVWLLPYRRTELTQACNPLKVFEYLATGKPVVSVPLDGLGACREAVTLAEGAAFEAAIERALAEPDAGRTRRLSVAAENAWDARVDTLERHLETARDAAAERAGKPVAALSGLSPGQAARSTAFNPAVNEYGSWVGRRRPDPVRATVARALQAAGRIRRNDDQAIRRILVTRRARLGDLIVLTPTLRALRRRFPEARITLGVQPSFGGSALLDGLIDELIELDFVWSDDRRQQLRNLLRLARRRFDLVLTGSSWFLLPEAFFAVAARRLGTYDGDPWQRLGDRLLLRDMGRHEADNNLSLVEALTGERETDRAPRLDLSPERVPAAAPLLDRLGIPQEGRLLVVHPGANRDSRRWPAAGFAAALERVLEAEPDLHVVLSGSSEESAMTSSVRSALPPAMQDRVHDASGRTSLPELVALLDRAGAALMNDTGTMHLARARGTPLLALFGPENHRLWGPHPDTPSAAVVMRAVVPCAPCAKLSCDAHYCMRSLEPAAVAQSLVALLRGEHRESLVRMVGRQDWRDLYQAGHDVPVASVVLSEPKDVARALDVVAAQTYPTLELVSVGSRNGWRDERDERARGHLPLRWADCDAMSQTQRWNAVLGTARGELLIRFDAERLRHRAFVGGEVAAALRNPEADAFQEGLTADPSVPLLAMRHTSVRRSALEALLTRPRPHLAAVAAPASPSRS